MHISLDFLSYRLSVVCLLSTEVWSDVMRYGDGTLKGGEYRACHRQSVENLLTVDLTTVSFSSLSSSQLITVSVVIVFFWPSLIVMAWWYVLYVVIISIVDY